jgi:hypothetical protein
VEQLLGKHRILMDWIWNIFLQSGIVDLCLARGSYDQAELEAARLVAMTTGLSERTWIANAHYQFARTALARGDCLAAKQRIAGGLAVIGNIDAPLASWRLHSLGAQLGAGPDHSRSAQLIIDRLAGSLVRDEDLRREFLRGVSTAPVAL